jgi:predicted HicB family RNase H-like nuclease
MKVSDRYLKLVEWSEEDGCYVGSCPGLMLGGVHGDDETEVYRELCRVVEEWVRIHEEDGEPLPAPTADRDYSGRFVLRTGEDLHRLLVIRSLQSGESLNAYCVRLLREGPPAHRASAVKGKRFAAKKGPGRADKGDGRA